MERILEFKGITKIFPGTVALDNVSFSVQRGQVHALVGENGAGKSTLMKILAGAYTPSSGTVVYCGETYERLTPAQADRLGIRIVYQELNQIPELTIADNIFLGQESFWLHDRAAQHRARECLTQLGIGEISPKTKIKNLGIGTRQLVEIAKATFKRPQLLIMDEPTSSLSENEVELLFSYIEKLKAAGCTVIYISHKLDELLRISDSVTVLRDGRHIHSGETGQLTKEALIRLMADKDMKDMFPARTTSPGKKLFEACGITKPGLVDDVSFTLYTGEIVGLSGLMGCGRTELAETLFGVHGKFAGEVLIDGQQVRITCPADAAAAGLGFVTEDRKRTGIVGLTSVGHNLTLAGLEQTLRLGIFTNFKAELDLYNKYKKKLNIKTPSFVKRISELSGGNQQKVIISKWVLKHPKILIMDEPTRGIDVRAKYEIYEIMNTLSAEGYTILFISSEIEEIMAMCDRAYVMRDHRIVAELDRAHLTSDEILSACFNGGSSGHEC